MSNVRRGYIYLACIASLEAVAWAVISLLRNLLAPGKYTSLEDTALQIAVIVVSLPIFLVHWLWAQRLAGRDPEERGAVLRRLYLYGAMATFLGPFLANAFDLLDGLLRLAFGLRPESYRYLGLSQAALIVHSLVAMAILALLWAYHWRVAAADAREIPEEGGAATVRRLYVYGFSAAGLAMTTLAVVYLSRWLMFQLGGGTIITGQADLIREVARLAVGLPLWLIFWHWAQRLFAAPDEEERASVLRKVYLYLAVFLSVLATVTTLTIVLADGLGRLLGVSRPGGGDIREALSILLGAGLVWAYHAYILRRDAALAGEPATAAWVRQLYHYLVAAIGLGAMLIGVAGDLTLLIRILAGVSFVRGVPEEAAWFTALIVVGLPVWILPWRRVQLAATTPGPAGDEESRSVIRKIYLYFYLFLATMTVLGSGVYLVFRLIGLALGVGQSGNLLADLGQAIAYSLMAVGIWLYHGSILRADGRRVKEMQAERLASLRVAVLDAGDESLGRVLLDELQRELPGLDLQTLDARAANTPAALAKADLIVGPSSVAVTGDEAARAIAASPAPKLLLPIPAEGWHWAGISELKTQDTIRQTVRAVKQFAAGEEIKAKPGLSGGAIIAIVVGSLLLLIGLAIPLLIYTGTRLMDIPTNDSDAAWSPDGRRIAFVSDRDGLGEIYVMNADGSGQTNLTNNPADDLDPAWSPDGKRITFASERDGDYEIYVMNADGSGQTRLTDNPAHDAGSHWSP